MQMVPSDPYHGGGRTSLHTKQRHRTALSTHIVSTSGAQATTGTLGQARQSRYETRELIGRGGMSEVYCGFDIELRRPVAIKRVRPELGNNPGFRRIAGVYNAGGEAHFGSGLTIDTAAELFGGKV